MDNQLHPLKTVVSRYWLGGLVGTKGDLDVVSERK
jgi:hypothetical protein